MSNVSIIVGLQWGDEGKGRVSHFISDNAICIRATGGNNAGHTVVANGKKFKPNFYKLQMLYYKL